MKKSILAAICLTFLITSCSANENQLPKGFRIETDCDGKCITVTTQNNSQYRIYSCGQIKQLTWKEVVPNQDSLVMHSVSGTWLTTDYEGNVVELTSDDVAPIIAAPNN